MSKISSLNEVNSQVWAVVLILLGIGCFGIACFCRQGGVEAALVSSATGMIGGGIAMFQHQEKDSETTTIQETTPQKGK